MTPSILQHVLGCGFRITLWTGAAIAVSLVFWACPLGSMGLLGGWYAAYVGIAVLAAIPLGLLLGAIILWPPLFHIASWVNGAPFRSGDSVYILVGLQRGRLTRVYDVWTERGQVRVELDEKSKNDVTDVFSWNEVCRQKKNTDL
jgi:hypothetical protein